MAKRKAKPAAEPVLDEREQKAKLARSVDTYTRCEIDCAICGEEDSSEASENEFARQLYADGWRYLVSEKFGLEGVLCPKCATTSDEDRGED